MKMSKIIAIILLFGFLVPSMFTALGDTEPNDSFDQAELVGEGTFSGTVSSSLLTPDEDYYKVSVPAEKSVLVMVISGSSADISLDLYDGNRVEQSSAYSSNGAMDYVFYDKKSSTTYTVYLHFYGDGDYNFTVAFRPSDMQSAATSVISGETVNGDIKVGEEVHWYKIYLRAKEGMNLTGTATGNGVCIGLYDAGGNELDTNYWNSQQNSFTLTYTTENAMDVYIKVYPVDYYGGYIDITYSFSIDVDSVPSAPRNLQATAGNGRVTLSWDPPSDDGGTSIQGYYLYRDGIQLTADGWDYWYYSIPLLVSDTTYTDYDVYNGITYNYTVTAVNWVGESDPSNEVSATPMSIPDAPYLDSDYIVAGDGYVEITWNAPSDDGGSPITEYKIYRGTSAGAETLLTTVNAPETTYKDASVQNGQTYYYQVSAVNGVGEGNRSYEVSATPKGPPVAPATLQVSVGKDFVTLTWTPPADNGGSPITGYKIYRGTVSGGEVFLSSVEASSTSYRDTSVENGQEYYYYVTALNEAGESSPSEEVSAIPKGPPEQPSNLQITVEKGSITLTWSAPSNDGGSAITGYKIYRGTSPESMECIATVDASSTTYKDTSIKPGETYYYKVTAINSEGESSIGASSSASVPSESPILWIVIVIIVLAVIGISAFWIKKKSGAKPPEEE